LGIYLLIGVLGLGGGFLSGLVGIGGGIVMAPLLLYIPPMLGFEPLEMKVVAGLTIVQGLAGCLTGAVSHRKFRFVSGQLSLYMGASIFIAAAVGGAASGWVSNEILLFIFAGLAFSAAVLMFVPVKGDSDTPDISNLSFSRFRAVTAALGVGLLGGMVGQGGSFILIPLMTAYVGIPTRIAIGSNLAIVLLSSLAAFIGKTLTSQINWLLTVPILLTVVPAARFGSLLSLKAPVIALRRILAALIALAAMRIAISAVSV